VIAIEKPGKNPSLAANYRPISLLSVCHKLLRAICGMSGIFNSSPVQQARPLGNLCDTVQLVDNFHPYSVEQNGSDCRQPIPHILYRLPAIAAILF